MIAGGSTGFSLQYSVTRIGIDLREVGKVIFEPEAAIQRFFHITCASITTGDSVVGSS